MHYRKFIVVNAETAKDAMYKVEGSLDNWNNRVFDWYEVWGAYDVKNNTYVRNEYCGIEKSPYGNTIEELNDFLTKIILTDLKKTQDEHLAGLKDIVANAGPTDNSEIWNAIEETAKHLDFRSPLYNKKIFNVLEDTYAPNDMNEFGVANWTDADDLDWFVVVVDFHF